MSKNKGGQPVDEFVHLHFTPVGEKTASRRWNMRCNYCPGDAHMHTPREGGGIDVDRAENLFNDAIWTPCADADGPEEVSLEDIDAEFSHLANQLVSEKDGDGLPFTIPVDQVYDLTTLDAIRAGNVIPISVDDELEVITQSGSVDTWDPASLLLSLGV
ncbi:hypothetical protein BDN70DRAFT_998543 [Pholiota conissans]|uniref:Uncharacterized protein n=1 Tax=Pholiota conissans TaxID=109636 RepID=A0A9P5YMI1_9AGAR|nr:hypothetical protein BDN70DRAFT_998543 [Pholiota conissans]